jgi:hypothetical protein
VALLLLGQPLLQRLEQLVPAERLQFGLLGIGQVLLRELAQPFLGNRRGLHRLAEGLQSLEHGTEHPVEPVEMRLVLHQRRARQEVEGLDIVLG